MPNAGNFIEWGQLGAVVFIVVCFLVALIKISNEQNKKIEEISSNHREDMKKYRQDALNCENRIAIMTDKCFEFMQQGIESNASLKNTINTALEFLKKNS